ncbi:ribonuclease HI [Parasphaerochaeta coccoides]|uniref:Ribonuclease H n=1 Tax=Parasphaerochaeta coccoides (strain ATCC BAA-1237 / DSM 17374 / SPN1) TaxID=760011 RepID=F4GLI6_PARC1|nr:ribonuclease HI [Parasphaerochaeta coccoides]AEC01956.1 RNase HI [Parasphaerochaeta coccoides DSM 17374]
MNDLTIYTDGGCSGNPGPGGWAYLILKNGSLIAEGSGGEDLTTNNRMELNAVIESLRCAKTLSPSSITVRTDSQYVKNGITTWILAWKRNGWRTASRDPVKNKEYWLTLDELAAGLPLTWHWVKGHAGIEHNERCDAMVRTEMDKILSLKALS